MTPFDMGMALVLAIVACVIAIGALIETHTWKVLVEDHARRIEALERGNKRERAAMVD
jgi:hypothetical protein